MDIGKIIELLEEPVFSVAISGEILSSIRPTLKGAGVRSFPVIAFTGKPGVGKTALACAVSCTEEDLLDFHEKKRGVINILKHETWRFSIVDDVAELNSYAGKQGQRTLLDQVVRWSYSGKIGIVGITMERAVLPTLSRSCRERLLEVDVGDGVNDLKFSENLTFLQIHPDYKQFLRRFREFYRNISLKIRDDLAAYRMRMAKQHADDARSVDMIWCYMLAMRCVQRFLKEENLGDLSMDAVEKIAEGLYARRKQTKSASQGSLANIVLHELIQTDAFRVQLCWVGDECSCHLDHGCKHRSARCDDGICMANLGCEWKTSYTLTDLMLSYDQGYNALLVDDPSCVPHVSHAYPVPPFLIVDSAELTFKANAMLKEFCERRGCTAEYWEGEKLRKELFEANRCMIIPNGDKGKRYTFEHTKIVDDEVLSFRAVAILLRDEEVAQLRDRSRYSLVERQRRFAYAESSGRMVKLLRKDWAQLECKCTEVGEYLPHI